MSSSNCNQAGSPGSAGTWNGGMKTFKPSFYTSTIVFTVTIMVLVLVIAGIMAALPDSRQHMTLFAAVVAIGGTLIVIAALLRIRKAELAYARQQASLSGANSLLGCPDSYLAAGQQCQPTTSKLTLDPYLVTSDKGRDGVVMQHTPAPVPMDMVAMRTDSAATFLGTDCKNPNYSTLPWATFKSLCP